MQLDAGRAPLTVANFLQYVNDGFYDGTIFHRVVNGFVIQGGGLHPGSRRRSPPVRPWSTSPAMASATGAVPWPWPAPAEPHSADSQFYINLADNLALDPKPTRWGYAVFGEVIQGLEIVDEIGHRVTGSKGGMQDVPDRARRDPKVSVVKTPVSEMTALFVSDLHLDASRPAATDCFLRFLAGPARDAGTLYILGDLFEAWIGDDAAGPHERHILDALRRYTRAGCRCLFLRGNRDFLVGARFAAETGRRSACRRSQIELAGQRALLMHGDTLCTDDHAYQRYRRFVHRPAVADTLSRPARRAAVRHRGLRPTAQYRGQCRQARRDHGRQSVGRSRRTSSP